MRKRKGNMKSSSKVLALILALVMLFPVLPTLGETAARTDEPDLFRLEAFTAAEGNIARGVVPNSRYSNGGARNTVTNGTLNTNPVHNSWGIGAGAANNTHRLALTFDEPYTITAMRVMWDIFTDTGVNWPLSAFVEYNTGATIPLADNASVDAANPQWVRAGRADSVIFAIPDEPGQIGVDGNSAGGPNRPAIPISPKQQNTRWNVVVFDPPITTTQLRLSAVRSGAGGNPGLGVQQWEVFGFSDPLFADSAWVRNQLGDMTNLTTNVTLPTTAPRGSTVAFQSSNVGVFANNGTITRPAVGQEPASGTLTVTVTLEGRTDVFDLNWRVLALLSDAELTAQDLAALDIGNVVNRDSNFDLPTTGLNGSDITWTSTNTANLWNDGSVLRPPQGADNVTAVLTASVTYGAVTDTRSWTVTIPAWPEGTARTIESHDPVIINQPHGNAPYLPNSVRVHYDDGTSEFRSIMWSRSSAANQTTDAARAVGTQYDITGNVMGDGDVGPGFVVTANVTVVAERQEAPTQIPVARALRLSEVTIDNDPDGQQNRLTHNRSGWTTYVLNQDVTRYIQPFRTAFGQDRTGYTNPTGWNGKLRGFGSGHYMSGLAMAWETPDLSAADTNTLISNMERMTRELRYLQELTIDVPHPTEDRMWEARDFFSDINLDGTPFPATGLPTLAGGTIGDRRVWQLRTSPHGTTRAWLRYAYAAEEINGTANHFVNADPVNPGSVPNQGPRTYGHGYLNAIPPHHLVGNESYLGYNDGGNGVWAPYYGLHKILAGLLEIYYALEGSDVVHTITGAAGPGRPGNAATFTITEDEIAQKAFQIAFDMSLWISNRLEHRTRPGINTAFPGFRSTMWGRYIAGEHGGVAESIARVAYKSRDERLLHGVIGFWNDGTEAGAGLNHFSALAHNRDAIRTLHANTHIPQITSSLWAYRIIGDRTFAEGMVTHLPGAVDGRAFFDMAHYFWAYNIGRYAWATGNVKGNTSNIETYVGAYNQVDHLRRHTGANETCAAYNLMKLAKYLNEHDPMNAAYLDHIEQMFIGQMVGSTIAGSTTGQSTYHYPIHQGATRGRGGAATTDASCCAGTAIENHLKYQDAIYFVSNNSMVDDIPNRFFVGLYKPSTATWTENNITIRNSTVWPSDRSTFSFAPTADTEPFEMMLRIPRWATDDFDIRLNGVSIRPEGGFEPSTYFGTGTRTWAATDVLEVYMPWEFWIDFLPQRYQGSWVGAVMYGPTLMATEGIATNGTLGTGGTGVNITASINVDSALTPELSGVTLRGTTVQGTGTTGARPLTRNVPTMDILVSTAGATPVNRTFLPHYFLGNLAFTTYFMVNFIDTVAVPDRHALFAAINEAGAFLEYSFTPESLTVLQTAITQAILAYQDPLTTVVQIEAAIVGLNTAIAGLESIGDIDPAAVQALANAVTAAEARNPALYTWDSVASFMTALENAGNILELARRDPPATGTGQVIAATNALNAASASLVAVVSLNRAILYARLEEAKSIENPPNTGVMLWPQHEFLNWTRLSWAALLEAIATAEDVYGNITRNFNQGEIDAASADLAQKMGSLVSYAISDERQDLVDILEEASGIIADALRNPGKFTHESVAALWFEVYDEENGGFERLEYASLTFLEMYTTIDRIQRSIDALVAGPGAVPLENLAQRITYTGTASNPGLDRFTNGSITSNRAWNTWNNSTSIINRQNIDPPTSNPPNAQHWGAWGLAMPIWIEFDFGDRFDIHSTRILWADSETALGTNTDGGIRVPTATSWIIEYFNYDVDDWRPVALTFGSTYAGALAVDAFNELNFVPFNSDRIRINFNAMNPGRGAGAPGIVEWEVWGAEVPRANKNELREVLAEAQPLVQNDFSLANWRLFQAARNHAQNVYDNVEGTQAEVDAATNNLRNLVNRANPLPN